MHEWRQIEASPVYINSFDPGKAPYVVTPTDRPDVTRSLKRTIPDRIEGCYRLLANWVQFGLLIC